MNVKGIELDMKKKWTKQNRLKGKRKRIVYTSSNSSSKQFLFSFYRVFFFFFIKNVISYIYCINLINIKPNKSEIKKTELMRSKVSSTCTYTCISTIIHTNAQLILFWWLNYMAVYSVLLFIFFFYLFHCVDLMRSEAH